MTELDLPLLEIAVENIDTLDEEGFAMARRNGLGASDTSAVLNLMTKFRGPEDVLENKLSKFYTDEEKAIGLKPNVKKGSDLEPLILAKAEERMGQEIIKPRHMYRIKQYPWLTINYDGLTIMNSTVVPVECKWVSTYADKYYSFKDDESLISTNDGPMSAEKITGIAADIGIPPYYYCQVQQQLMGVDGEFAFLAVLRDKTWDLHMFVMPENKEVQEYIATETFLFWKRVQNHRK